MMTELLGAWAGSNLVGGKGHTRLLDSVAYLAECMAYPLGPEYTLGCEVCPLQMFLSVQPCYQQTQLQGSGLCLTSAFQI